MRPNSSVWLGAAAVAASLAMLRAPALQAQRETTMATSTDLLNEPGGHRLAVIRKGAPVAVGASRGTFTEVTLDGWVSAALLGGKRDTFAISVKEAQARLRASSSAKSDIVAEMELGMGLIAVRKDGGWMRVKRTGWVPTRALTAIPAAAPRSSSGGTTGGDGTAAPAGPPPAGALTPAGKATIRLAPGAKAIAAVDSGAWLEPIARERGWVQVRVQGWVKESDLLPADTALGIVSAADLRADPQGTKGRVVHWNVQVYALQNADPLHKDFAEDEPYLLAKGPEGEDALLYLAVPPSLMTVARGLPALARITITARVRTGRSDPTGVPILDLQTITRR